MNKIIKSGQSGRLFILMKNRLMALVFGWITILVLMLASSLLLALIVRFSEVQQSTMNWLTLGLSLAILFFAGLMSGAKGKEKGWMLGALTAIGFTLFVLLFQYLGYQKGFSVQQWTHHGGFLLAALLGGVFGVNVSGGPTTQK